MSFRVSSIAICAILTLVLIACSGDAEPEIERMNAPNQLIVNIDGQGAINVIRNDTGERLREDAARQYVESVLRAKPGTKAEVRTGPAVPTESLVRVLDWLNRIGAASLDAPVIQEL